MWTEQVEVLLTALFYTLFTDYDGHGKYGDKDTSMQPDPWESMKSSVGGCVSSGNTVKLAVHIALILYSYRMRLFSAVGI